MITIHNLGFPRIGAHRELKFALESFWKGDIDKDNLQDFSSGLRKTHWQQQRQLSLVPVGDFSLYDHVLDISFTLGVVPDRIKTSEGNELDRYFRAARGRSANDSPTCCTHAGEMTKWFDTNYHYIVPEFDAGTQFKLNSDHFLAQIREAKYHHVNFKPVIIGPVTYLWLGKSQDDTNKLDLLPSFLPVYRELLEQLSKEGADWVQIDEPILATELSADWRNALRISYEFLTNSPTRLLLTTYFGPLRENLPVAASLPVAGIHLDAISARDEVDYLINNTGDNKIISLGVINGRNIWKTDLNGTLDWLEPISQQLGSRLWLAPSCSLLHVPVDLNNEVSLDPEIRSWLAFALQKLEELRTLSIALTSGRSSVARKLQENADAIASRRSSNRVNNPAIKALLKTVSPGLGKRHNAYAVRAPKQSERLPLPAFPTTTIGSFPQTPAIRQARQQWRKGELDESRYDSLMKQEIEHAIRQQETLELDVLVHGEAERNDMVEYFGEQLDGYAFSQFGWVQSYGSRCVKPPILYGDISRPNPMTLKWILYAQSLTDKPVKGMLTGPVTMLNWSFVRDDQPRSVTCYQLAFAIRTEVQDLEKAGVGIIQIDEAALREGLPLRQSQWQDYLQWAVDAFRICANGVSDETQIHTHMCYSEFNDIIEDIARMDADVITIETSRSNMELLDAFENFAYPNQIGPGVYDIHSPNIPSVPQIVELMRNAGERIPAAQLWVNPDCGLKTRQWGEVTPALQNMVKAAKTLRTDS